MLLVNNHILKMAMLKSSAEYDRRIAIEGLRAGRSATQLIIRFFRYPRSIIYDIVAKYTVLEQSKEQSRKFQYASEEESLERTYREDFRIERAQALISDDSKQSLRVLMDIVKL